MATIILFSTKIIALNVYAWEVVSSHPLDFLELMAITLIHLGSLNTFPVAIGLKSPSSVLTLGTIQAASKMHFAVCVCFNNNFKQCNCSSDFLAIYDGVSEGTYANPTPMIGKYCGDLLPPNQISSDNVLYIHFHTDWYDDNNNGFKLEYQISGKHFETIF